MLKEFRFVRRVAEEDLNGLPQFRRPRVVVRGSSPGAAADAVEDRRSLEKLTPSFQEELIEYAVGRQRCHQSPHEYEP